MYFPAYDSPAIQKGLPEYSGKPAKKLCRAAKLSLAVERSLYSKLGSVLTEKPTPAGDSMKSRCESRCQE